MGYLMLVSAKPGPGHHMVAEALDSNSFRYAHSSIRNMMLRAKESAVVAFISLEGFQKIGHNAVS